ncbi:beta-class carbonic anhydrase [Gorillibacterium sp. sgz500922]|uniref:beta-class carbonic anhydrase n=1 Tax=Gorillibacterium sp. sgz500922 TaxID=3446694 RepID=UPI003F66FBA5
MSRLTEILEYNRTFVQNREYEAFRTTKFPDKKVVILTCMDTRLVELLPKAMNLKNGDAKIIKSAGAIVAHPFGSIMRSILVAIYSLGAEEVLVVGHHDCGMTSLNPDEILSKAASRGISSETIRTLSHSGIDLKRFLSGFHSVTDAVADSVSMIRNHPLLPADIGVHGLVIHPETGELSIVTRGKETPVPATSQEA